MSRIGRLFIPLVLSLTCTAQDSTKIMYVRVNATLLQPVQASSQNPAADDSIEQQLFRLVNDQRKAHRLTTLEVDQRLVQVARAHSALMAARKTAKPELEGEADVKSRHYAARIRAVNGNEVVALMRDAADDPAQIALEFPAIERRDQLLKPELTSLGVGVIRDGASLYVTFDLATEFNLTAEQAEAAFADKINRLRKAAGKSPQRFRPTKPLREEMCAMADAHRLDWAGLRRFGRPGSSLYLHSGPEPTVSAQHLKELTYASASEVLVGACDTGMEYWVGVVANP